jgi:hypothetical protein
MLILAVTKVTTWFKKAITVDYDIPLISSQSHNRMLNSSESIIKPFHSCQWLQLLVKFKIFWIQTKGFVANCVWKKPCDDDWRGSAATRLPWLRVRIPSGHGCLPLEDCWMLWVAVSAMGWSLVQRCRTECGVSECDREASTTGRSAKGGKKWNVEWSKTLCAPDDYSTKNTQKYVKQFQSLTMIT